jgi:hypothetical protein
MAVMTGLVAAAAKLAGLSGTAKAAAGIAVATASLATAGATGSLPDPVQDRFDGVVETVTGDHPPAPGGPGENADFGDRVSDDAKDGGVDGGEISEEARSRGEEHRPDSVPAPDDPGKPTAVPGPEDRPAPVDPPTAVPTVPAGAPDR